MSKLAKAERKILERRSSDDRQMAAFRKLIRLHQHEIPRLKLTSFPISSPVYPKPKFFLFQTMLVLRFTEVMVIVEGNKDIGSSSVPKHCRRAILGCGAALVCFPVPFNLCLLRGNHRAGTAWKTGRLLWKTSDVIWRPWRVAAATESLQLLTAASAWFIPFSPSWSKGLPC